MVFKYILLFTRKQCACLQKYIHLDKRNTWSLLFLPEVHWASWKNPWPNVSKSTELADRSPWSLFSYRKASIFLSVANSLLKEGNWASFLIEVHWSCWQKLIYVAYFADRRPLTCQQKLTELVLSTLVNWACHQKFMELVYFTEVNWLSDRRARSLPLKRNVLNLLKEDYEHAF